MEIVFWTLGILLGLFVILSVVGGWLMVRFSMKRDEKRLNNAWDGELWRSDKISDADFAKLEEGAALVKNRLCEFCSITSRDGLKLSARLFPHPEARGIFLMAHGYRSSSIQDFSGAIPTIWGMGYSLFMIDQRAHGRSEGKYLTFGVKERYDVVDWAAYLKERFPDLPVVADGVSMGSGTVMFACGVGWPDNVRAVIADCGYSTAGEICRVCMKRWFHLPAFPVYYAAKLWTRILAGYDPDSVSARESLAKLEDPALYPKPLPVLIAHGNADGFVPYYMSEENVKAFLRPDGSMAPHAEFFTADGADHGMAFLSDYDGYMAALGRLFDKARLPHDKVEIDESVEPLPEEGIVRPGAHPEAEMDEGEIFTVN